MTSSSVRDLLLDKLEQGTPGITQAWGALLAEASSVCLECHKHPRGIELKVYGSESTVFRVFWSNDVTEQVLSAWDDDQDYTEFGACGIAVLLILELTEFTVIRRARKGTGVDYWLGFRDTEKPFQNAARLEVSGILKGDNSTIRSRVNQKKRQTEPTDGTLPAYVVVVEFSKPLSHMVKK
jgi:hypothetical protein